MRLKAVTHSVAFMSRVCSSLSKIGSSESNFVIRFTPSKIHFIARDNQNASAFVYVDANILFDYYEIESLNRNEITMELSFARLERVLKLATSDSGRNEVTLRLSKNKETHRPLLSIRCKMFNIEGNELTVNHEFPCKIFHPDESVVNEPVMGKMLAYVLLPDVQLIRNIVDKLKGIDSKMLVSVSMRGCLGFQVKTDFVQVNIELDELERPEINTTMTQSQTTSINCLPDTDSANTPVSIASFEKIIRCAHLNPKEIVCCAYGSRGLVFHVFCGDRGGEDDWGGCVVTYFVLPVSFE